MKVLSIGSDRNLFVDGSAAQKRIKEYGKLFNELHIIVFSKQKSQITNHKSQIADNIWVYPTNSRNKLFYLLDAYRIGKNLIGNWKLEIGNCAVSAQDPFEAGLVGWLLKRKYKLPLQLQIHTDIFNPYFYRESLKNKLRVWLAKFLLPLSDGIRVVSERIKQSLITQLPNYRLPIIVLPIFVDIKKIQSAKIKMDLRQKYPDYDFRILMASRLTKEKNIGLAIEAMTEVAIKYPKALLVVVGEGSEAEKLKVKSEKLKVADNVKFEPWTDDLASYYKTADIFLLTSNYEGYGRTVVEAMAAGLPVIMTDVGLAGEVLIDDLDGIIISPGNRNALEEAILNLTTNPEKQAEFRNNSLKAVANFAEKDEYLRQYQLALRLLLKLNNG